MLTLAKRPTLALDVNIVQDNLPIEIAPRLYLGSIHAAFNQEALSSHKITHILNASRLPPSFPKQFTYLSVDVRDKEDANILSCIPASNIFIEAGVEAGGVLVHCFGGRSRSAAFIAAYLMCHCGWSYEHTLKVIVAARPVASVNKGFEKQLKAYALTNFDVYATQQVLLRNRIKALHCIRALNESKAGFIRGSFREGPIGGNKRSWADRDSFCAKALNLADEEQKAIEEEEEGVEEEEEADGDEDIESEKDQLSEMDEPSKLLPALSPDNFLKDNKEFPPYLLNNFNSEEETLPCKNRKQRNRVVRISGSMTPLSTKRTAIPYLDPKSPRCRLSRPGSSTVRVIPPLRGLERAVCCAYCGEGLFCLANVLRVNVNARGSREVEKDVEEARTSYSSASSSSSPSPATSFSTPSPYLSVPLNLSIETRDRTMSNTSLDDNKGSNDFKTFKRDLKRDSDGEHKFDRTPDLSSTSYSPKGGGYSELKRPQSVRGSVKHFDFDFEKPAVSSPSPYPGGASNGNGNGNGGGRRGFEKECQRSNRFGLSRGSSEDYLEGEEERYKQRARERDRDKLRETGEGEDVEDQERSLWGRSVSDDIIASAYCTNSLRGQKAMCKLKEGGLATVSEGSEKALENLNQVLGHGEGQVQVLSGVRRKSLSDVKSPGGPSITLNSPSFLPNAESNCGSLLNAWNSADTLYSDRSASAENRRWLARMSLLSAPSTSAVTPSSSSQSPSSTSGHGGGGDRRNGQVDALKRMRQMAHDDEEAMRLIFCGTDSDPSSSSSGSDVQHLYIEYLSWMDPDGRVLDPGRSDIDDRDRDRDGFKEFSCRSRGGSDQEDRERDRDRDRDRDRERETDRDTGEIKCRQCDRLIGKWTWVPTKSQSLTGQLEPPVFMIEKSHVRQADFSLDPSPQSTPCLADDSEECSASGSFTYGSDGI